MDKKIINQTEFFELAETRLFRLFKTLSFVLATWWCTIDIFMCLNFRYYFVS